MRAAVLTGAVFNVGEQPNPQPARGQLLVAPLFSGICGSDLHRLQEAAGEGSSPHDHHDHGLVMGHEFSSEVLDIGPDTDTRFKRGDRIVGLPFVKTAQGYEIIGFSANIPGGFGTQSIMLADRSFRLPDAVPADLAALTEPLAVGLHAANLANRNRGPNVIIGGGPVGLAVLLALKAQGRGPNLVSEFSPERRAIAEALGADIVVDPAESSPYSRWGDLGFTAFPGSPLLDREFSRQPHGVNIFECVGAPGLIDQIVKNAPKHSHVIVAGACMHEDRFTPLAGIGGEVTIEFSGAYRYDEFEASLRMIGDRPEWVDKLVTSRRPLADIQAAFDTLASSPAELKILIQPSA